MLRSAAWTVSFSLLVLMLAACGRLGDESEAALDPASVGERYIVVLADAPDRGNPDAKRAEAAQVARAHGLAVNRTYGAAIVGFAAHVPEGRLEALRRDPRVAYVETDDPVEIFAEVPTGISRIFADGNGNIKIDGTDERIDVDVAVIDTGVDFDHPDLNVAGGVDCMVTSGGGPPWGRTYYCSSNEGTGGDDDHYHGTHVAGTIAAIDNGTGVVGVAPGARLWAVKVLDSSGSGYLAGILAGIDWVTANADVIEVANMSLGGSGFSQSEYDAIQASIEAGVAYAVAAGNSGADANDYSPAAFDNVLTVSALADFDGKAGEAGSPTCRTDQDDTLADFSNWGDAVQVAAPGVCILSTYPLEQGEYGTISGTSMASPHAAGTLALLASKNPARLHETATKEERANAVLALYDTVVMAGNSDWSDDSGDGIHEPLLDTSDDTLFAPLLTSEGAGGDPGGEEPSNAAPKASFTYSCSELACDFDGTDSEDSDGTIASYEWEFGDGATGADATTSHTYGAGGTFTVTLTITDDGGISDSNTQDVTVTEPSAHGITLSVVAYKVKGVQHADLEWSGATGTNVDVRRDGETVATTGNDGAHTDETRQKGGGSAIYQVCEASTTTCSSEVTAIW